MENNIENRKRILSGIQPSGVLTLGNYIGAMRNFVALQEDYDAYYMIADLHALTVPQVAKDLRNNILSTVAQYLAVGLNPDNANIFIQSHVSGHTELAWVLSCITALGQLSRMTQFKDKSARPGASINAGLYTYPDLMAADILLYNADLVPVGEDQKQHLELTRDLAAKFNHVYSPTFTVPEPLIPEAGARIMDLQNPLSKMSKSCQNRNGMVSLIDEPNIIIKKIKSAVTDSGREVVFGAGDEKAGIRNLLTIYSVLGGVSIADLEVRYEGRGYGDFKGDLADLVVETLRSVKEKHDELLKNKDYLLDVLKQGADNAQKQAWKTISKVYRKVGLVAPKR